MEGGAGKSGCDGGTDAPELSRSPARLGPEVCAVSPALWGLCVLLWDDVRLCCALCRGVPLKMGVPGGWLGWAALGWAALGWEALGGAAGCDIACALCKISAIKWGEGSKGKMENLKRYFLRG